MEIKRYVYLDNAATTPLNKEVFAKMVPYFENDYGNPSSLYTLGRKSASALNYARNGIAECINAKASEIIFTGSGTESDNLAIFGCARANKHHGNHILISSIEHKAILESAKQLEKEGFNVEYIPVDKTGRIDIDDCISRIQDNTILISVMYANNEIGTIQPIEELGRRLKEFKNQQPVISNYPLFHTDACQAAGQLTIDVKKLGVDMMTLNAGKIYGPKGIGVLYKKEDVPLHPIVVGGGQEGGLRSGTESIPLAVGMYEALLRAEEIREEESKRLSLLRDYCLQQLQEYIPDCVINGHLTERLPNNIHISIPAVEGEAIILMLDEMGIQAGTGSACSSKDLEVSHVLKAIKQDEKLMHGSIRFSLGRETYKDDIDYTVCVVQDIVTTLKSMSSLTAHL